MKWMALLMIALVACSDDDALPGALCPSDPLGDGDKDGVCGSVDNCPTVANADQTDEDDDGNGDACDACPAGGDADQDGTCDDVDPCPVDADDICDASCPDGDDDGLCDAFDPCPDAVECIVKCENPTGLDADFDGVDDGCDGCLDDPINDPDADSICGNDDVCPETYDPDQADLDGDDIGDACDSDCSSADADGDGWCDLEDLCPSIADPDQIDIDGDGLGIACDPAEGLPVAALGVVPVLAVRGATAATLVAGDRYTSVIVVHPDRASSDTLSIDATGLYIAPDRTVWIGGSDRLRREGVGRFLDFGKPARFIGDGPSDGAARGVVILRTNANGTGDVLEDHLGPVRREIAAATSLADLSIGATWIEIVARDASGEKLLSGPAGQPLTSVREATHLSALEPIAGDERAYCEEVGGASALFLTRSGAVAEASRLAITSACADVRVQRDPQNMAWATVGSGTSFSVVRLRAGGSTVIVADTRSRELVLAVRPPGVTREALGMQCSQAFSTAPCGHVVLLDASGATLFSLENLDQPRALTFEPSGRLLLVGSAGLSWFEATTMGTYPSTSFAAGSNIAGRSGRIFAASPTAYQVQAWDGAAAFGQTGVTAAIEDPLLAEATGIFYGKTLGPQVENVGRVDETGTMQFFFVPSRPILLAAGVDQPSSWLLFRKSDGTSDIGRLTNADGTIETVGSGRIELRPRAGPVKATRDFRIDDAKGLWHRARVGPAGLQVEERAFDRVTREGNGAVCTFRDGAGNGRLTICTASFDGPCVTVPDEVLAEREAIATIATDDDDNSAVIVWDLARRPIIVRTRLAE